MNLKYDFWLASLTNINSKQTNPKSVELCGSAQAVYVLRKNFKNIAPFYDNELQHLLESRKKDLNRAWERFLGQNIQMFPIGSKKYPQRLKDIAVFPFGPAGRSGGGLKALIASSGHKTRHKGKQGQRACHRNSISCQWVTHKKTILDCLGPAGKKASFQLIGRAVRL